MQDALDNDKFVRNVIKDPVAAMGERADGWPDIRMDGADFGMIRQHGEACRKALYIGFRSIPAEHLRAIFQYRDKIGVGSVAKFNARHGYHAGRGLRR